MGTVQVVLSLGGTGPSPRYRCLISTQFQIQKGYQVEKGRVGGAEQRGKARKRRENEWRETNCPEKHTKRERGNLDLQWEGWSRSPIGLSGVTPIATMMVNNRSEERRERLRSDQHKSVKGVVERRGNGGAHKRSEHRKTKSFGKISYEMFI